VIREKEARERGPGWGFSRDLSFEQTELKDPYKVLRQNQKKDRRE
jgi:hypothetical protein